LRQSALLADLQRCCFSPNQQLADFLIGNFASFLKKLPPFALKRRAGRFIY